MDVRRRRVRLVARLLGVVGASSLLAGVALAHGGGGLRSAAPERLAVPTWLFLLTGGGAVGASFILASFVTDRAFVESLHGWRAALPAPLTALRWAGHAVGLAGLAVVLAFGYAGPPGPLRNLSVLAVWVAWWAGLTMATYLVGNAWPALNPWRTLSRRFGEPRRSLPERVGSWPAAAALLALVYLEVVSPLAADPRLLADVVLAYSGATLLGAWLFGPAWFRRVDPVAGVFRLYGRVAPVQRTDDGLRLRLPGSALTDRPLADRGEVALVVALLWGTTFDGLVSTPGWATVAEAAASVGVPPRLVYLLALLAGFAAFLAAFGAATRLARRTAPTYRSAADLSLHFAGSLLPIAAGYHLAHYLGYLLSLSPALLAALADPLAPPASPPTLALPGWFGGLPLAFVLLGHLLAIWVAHAVAFDALPGRLQAVRSQYPLTAAMVGYTTVSLWIVSRPTVTPPFL